MPSVPSSFWNLEFNLSNMLTEKWIHLKEVLPGEIYLVRNSIRCDSKPSEALDPAELF